MADYKIRLNEVEDVKKFVHTISDFEGDVIIRSGKYAVDAKSILGIFSLNLTDELILEIENPTEAELAKIDSFLVKE